MKKSTILTLSKFQNKNVDWFSRAHILGDKLIVTDGRNYAGTVIKRTDENGSIYLSELKKVLGRGEIDSMTISDKEVCLAIGAKKFTFGNDEIDPVRLPEVNGEITQVFTINTLFLKAKSFISKDELRPAMCCLYYDAETSRFVATDAHRLYFKETKLKLDKNVLIDKSIFDIPAGDYKVQLLKDHLYLEGKEMFFFLHLSDERFPDYKGVLPTHKEQTLHFNKSELKDIIQDALICANQVTNSVKVLLGTNKCVICSEDIDLNKSFEGEIQFTKDSVYESIFGFNGNMMLACLDTIDSDVISIDLISPNRPMIINKEVLLMPVMI